MSAKLGVCLVYYTHSVNIDFVINLLKLKNGHIGINYNLVCTDFESNPNKEIAGRIQIDIAGKICDFLNSNRMPIESCFHAVSTLVLLYLLSFEYQ